VRLNAQHRKTTTSNGNQVCRVFSRTQWEHILFVCYETSGFDLAPNITQSSDDRQRDPWSVDHRREIHGSLEGTHGYLLVFTFPPSMFGCSMFQDLCQVKFICSRIKKIWKSRVIIVTLKLCRVWKRRYTLYEKHPTCAV
jgi:hypothetical protein